MDAHHQQITPYRTFSRAEWAKLRADTPLTLNEEELNELRGLNERVNLDEVVAIYLPLSASQFVCRCHSVALPRYPGVPWRKPA